MATKPVRKRVKKPGRVLERIVERIVDADFPQEMLESEKFLFRFGGTSKRATAKDLAALRAFHAQNALSNRLENGRVGLLMIADTPEHEEGTALLKKAERACLDVKDEALPGGIRVRAGDNAAALLDHLVDVIRAGLRRKDIRRARAIVRAGRSEGGKARAQNRRDELALRDQQILAERERMLREGVDPHEIAGKLAARVHRGDRLTASIIRRIFKKAGVS